MEDLIKTAFEDEYGRTAPFIQDFIEKENLKDKLFEYYKDCNKESDFNGYYIEANCMLGDADGDEDIDLEITFEEMEQLRKWKKAYCEKYGEDEYFGLQQTGCWEGACGNLSWKDLDIILNMEKPGDQNTDNCDNFYWCRSSLGHIEAEWSADIKSKVEKCKSEKEFKKCVHYGFEDMIHTCLAYYYWWAMHNFEDEYLVEYDERNW